MYLPGRRCIAKTAQLCHAYDGSGKTEIGSGQYPRPPDLRSADVQRMSDGELFYHIKNGIRHTGMPAWELPDRKIWQVAAYLRNLPKVAALSPEMAKGDRSRRWPRRTTSGPRHAKTATPRSTTAGRRRAWPMSCRIRASTRTPSFPDLTKPDPLLNFTKDDIAFTYGSRWKQRYFKQIGDDYFVFPAQWDVTHKMWRPYFVKNGTDWWATLYPPDNFQRPTGPLCDGCHSVNYDIATKKVTEWNVGCERCHGAGSEHVAHQGRPNIINPAQARLRARQRRVYSMPLTRPAAEEPDPGQVLRLAGRLSRGQGSGRLLEVGGTQAGRDLVHAFCGRHRRTRTGCRATTSCRA